MRSECSSHKFAHGDDLPVNRLMTKVSNRMQLCTQRYDKRPYGVGLLVAGYDVSTRYLKYYTLNLILWLSVRTIICY